MEQINNNEWALITGASTGIGYELAKLFAQDGYNIIAVARTESDLRKVADELKQQYGVQVEVMPKDLFGENASTELYNEVKAKGIEVEVLINDAGQGVYGLFTETDLEDQVKIIHLNIVSLTRLTYHFLKDMVARNSGKILQLASIASETPGPYQAVYHATKAYVLSFTESLISEVKNTGVTITALQPGATDTDFFNKADMTESKMVQDKSKLSDPADVAKDGHDALMDGDDKIISGFKNKVMIAMTKLMPETMVAEQMKKQQEPVDKDKAS
ncbi:MAG: family oxidoreductase [Flavisolibacter sp.]|nr:family oxidoreductase [Flavisolibacter sp.]